MYSATGCKPDFCTGVCDPYTGCDRCKNGTRLPDCYTGMIAMIVSQCIC